jgi:hypothetical protein
MGPRLERKVMIPFFLSGRGLKVIDFDLRNRQIFAQACFNASNLHGAKDISSRVQQTFKI